MLFSVGLDHAIGGGIAHAKQGETLAHLNCLLRRGRISRSTDNDGIHWYQQVPETAEID